MVYLMHGSCVDKSLFSKYNQAITKNDFVYSGILLGLNAIIQDQDWLDIS
jgi:hypothetical protein